jgi:hypothetical protein
MSLQDFLTFISRVIIEDPAAPSYGLRDTSGAHRTFWRVPQDDSGSGAAESTSQDSLALQTRIETILRGPNGTPDGSFRLPQLDYYIECLPRSFDAIQEGQPREGASALSILRIHIFDRNTTSYDTQAALLESNREEELRSITHVEVGTGGNPGVRESHAEVANTVIQAARNANLIERIENSEPPMYRIKGGPQRLKEFMMKTSPYILVGAQGTTVKDAALSTQQNQQLSTVNILRSFHSDPLQPNGESPGGLPLQVIPCDLSVNSMGCPLLDYGTKFFVDFGTGTTIDNYYFVTGLSHKFSAGSFDSDIKFSINPDGLITGIVKLKSSPIFAIVNKLSINISGIYNYSDNFTYELQNTTINFNNPLSLKLINRDNLYLKTTDYVSPSGCTVDDDSGGVGKENDPKRKQVNGIHIRRKNPFTIRAIYSYKNLPINGAKITCRIYDSSGGPCSIIPKNFLGSVSSAVVTNSNVFASVKENSPILDGNGNPTGFSETISYSDIPVIAPFLPQDATVYIKCDANNYITIKKMNLFFPGLLKINITPSSPDSNNIDIKEQFARAYLIDPDNPTDSSKFTNVPDGTIAKWELKQGTSIVRRIPFYSIDNVPLTTGVYSYFRSGSSRNVFIGPANPSSAGVYTLTVSTTARGLFGEASAQIEIKGNSGSEFEHFIPDPELPRILAEFPDTVNYIWTDGVDYQKMIISRDANRSTTKYKNKFIECSSGTLLPLPPGTVVNIQAKGYEILTGDVVELVDENGNKYLEDSSAIRNTDFAQVTLSSELYSYVYFRRNEFITDAGCRDLQNNNCSAFDAPATICYDPYDIGQDLAVIVSAKINFAGKPLTIYGGGHFGNDGRPPCVLIPIEPLYVRYFGLFVNGKSVSDFAVDGTTIHHMYFQLKYKENNVPTGTPVEVFACNLNPTPPLEANETCRRINSNVGVPTFVYVYNTNQLPGDSTIYEETFSLIDIPIGPISSDNDIAVGIYPSINFINGNSVLIESSSSSSSSSV